MDSKSVDLLSDYLYHVTVAPASGEYAMNSLLEPAATGDGGAGVYAREPLGGGVLTNSFIGSKGEGEKSPTRSTFESVKVLFGDHDWMRFHEPAARKEMESLSRHHDILADVHIVPKAGHHLYLDNADCFVGHILED